MEMSSNESEPRMGLQGVRPLLVVAAFACLLGATVPAWAAEVVDVRVGRHDGFARVVLEFDAPVSYKVERSAAMGADNELLITLDAAAQARTLHPKQGAVQRIEIVPGSDRRSTLRMKLNGEDLKLKEMILSKPPRIVLDILETAPVASTPKPAAQQAAERVPVEPPVAKQEVSDPSASIEVSKASQPVSTQPPASLSSDAALPDALREVKRKLALGEKKYSPTPEVKLRNEVPENTAPDAAKRLPSANPFLSSGEGEPAAPKPMAETSPTRPAPPPAATARPQVTPHRPAVMPPPARDAGQFSFTNVTVLALGVLLLVGAGMVFVRGRNRASIVDAEFRDVPSSDDANPFGGLSASDEIEAETEEVPADEAAHVEVGIPIPEDDAGVEVLSLEAEGVVEAPTNGGGDMLAGFETRMAALKGRIDELGEAKQRLEHQIAAQTEELRVQRAAIARTQRAVRNLSRPGEDAPTEPALRDPSRPEGPRED